MPKRSSYSTGKKAMKYGSKTNGSEGLNRSSNYTGISEGSDANLRSSGGRSSHTSGGHGKKGASGRVYRESDTF